MPTFSYRGYNAQGNRIGGSLHFASRAQMEQALDRLGIAEYELFTSKTLYQPRPYAAVAPGELALFCRAAAVVFSSALMPAEGLRLLAGQIRNEQLRIAVTEIGGHLGKGITPVGAFSMYDHVFGHYFNHVLAAGENAGGLSSAFLDLATFYEREAGFRQKLNRLIYIPLLRIVAVWLVVYGVMRAILPTLEQIVSRTGVPPSTAFQVTHFMVTHGWVLFALAGLGVGIVYGLSGVTAARRWIDRRLATGSLVRHIIMPLYTQRLAFGVTLLLRRGVPLQETEASLRTLVNNYAMEDKIVNAFKRINSGQDFTVALEAVRHFPPFFSPAFYNILLTGHHTGKMADMLDCAARWFELETHRVINRAAALLATLLTALFALAVGGFLWAVLTSLLPLSLYL